MDLTATADGGTTVETIDQTKAYELSNAYPVSQATLFDAFLNAAVLKEIWGVSSITVDATPGGVTWATLSFLATAAGSEVTVRMENFETSEERDANREAWEAGLRKLRRSWEVGRSRLLDRSGAAAA